MEQKSRHGPPRGGQGPMPRYRLAHGCVLIPAGVFHDGGTPTSRRRELREQVLPCPIQRQSAHSLAHTVRWHRWIHRRRRSSLVRLGVRRYRRTSAWASCRFRHIALADRSGRACNSRRHHCSRRRTDHRAAVHFLPVQQAAGPAPNLSLPLDFVSQRLPAKPHEHVNPSRTGFALSQAVETTSDEANRKVHLPELKV